MIVAAAVTAARSLHGVATPVLLSFSSVVIAAMVATGTLKPDIAVLVPVGSSSMIIANAMNVCAQAAERFRADLKALVGGLSPEVLLSSRRSCYSGTERP
jgi:putative ABC transport system permease protein